MRSETQFDVVGEVWRWTGPVPWHVVTLPEPTARRIAASPATGSDAWGRVPVLLSLGATAWRTALVPHDGGYLAPLRPDIRRRERIALGDIVVLRVALLGDAPT
ncbi:DUF1905 domain-containing protein [Nocardioides sp. TRM66260-LWL]|uniref:DUF1905 domain-containing protein n=1 Tax=Nocardioides sp. TRM66260-LWL TaxID=2874478 RepID=UPI001CC64785|nr:DUF1905 domain-containing protein [Nocardioides sp. TRM66260-LWL]MBZ5735931.1 DUF1905 domain-containing protein [Nocardioides sp. TRM66260-LWL]